MWWGHHRLLVLGRLLRLVDVHLRDFTGGVYCDCLPTGAVGGVLCVSALKRDANKSYSLPLTMVEMSIILVLYWRPH